MKRFTLTLVLIILALAQETSAQIPAAFANHLQYMLDSLCKKRGIKGASAAVLIPGMGIWKGASGISHGSTPLTTDMQLPIGSNTKTFNAAIILKLQENGQISLDDTIGKWFQNVPNVNGQITVRQLLNHTSGLYNYTNNPAFVAALNADYTKIWQPEDMLQWVSTPYFAPGANWEYSNTNFLLTGLIIKKILNQSFAAAVRSIVLTPQNLTNTFTMPDETPSGIVPHGWSVNASNPPRLEDLQETYSWDHNAFMSMAGAAGAITSTAEDNVKFWNALMTGKIININSLTQMMTTVPINSSAGYGLGVFRYNSINGHTGYCHGGTCFGYINENFRDSVNGICITVLSNQDSITNNYLFNWVVVPIHAYLRNLPPTVVSTVTPQLTVQLYPNPANGFIYIDIKDAANDLKIDLLDMTGRKMLTNTLSAEHNTIATDALPAGLYIAHITGASGISYTQKIQVTH